LWSRADWHHPGPAFFYLLAVPYRLLGSSSVAVSVGALAINAATIAALGWIAYRRGRTPLLLCMLAGLSVLILGLGGEFLRSPGNPALPVLPYALMLLLTWSMVCGELWALPSATAVATFLMQTHVGFVVLALPLLFGGAAFLVARSRVRGRRRL